MKIGFDAKRALMNETGLGVYSRNLINAMLHFYPQHEYFLFSPSVKDELLEQIEGDFSLVLPERTLDKLFPAYWRAFSCKRDIENLRLDVFHGLSNELPFGIDKLKQVKKIVTIHDLIFLKEKSQYPFTDRFIYEAKVRHSCKAADKVIAISGQTKSDLVELLSVKESKIEVVYQSCDTIFSKTTSDAEREQVKLKYSLPENFILNVSSFYPRKNQLLLVKAFEQIQNKIPHHLILVGGYEMERNKVETYIAENKLDSRIKILSNLPKTDLAILYQLAGLFVYPSKFEGFGIPILEAMSSGTPVIASDIDCFREIGGDTALYFSENDVNQLSGKMSFSTQKSTGLSDKLKERSRIFSIENFCKKTFELYT